MSEYAPEADVQEQQTAVTGDDADGLPVSGDPEATVADKAEQATAPTAVGLGGEVPFEADLGEVSEGERFVELDPDEYR